MRDDATELKWRVFDQTLAEVRGKFADLSAEEIETLVEEAATYAGGPNDSTWDDFFDKPKTDLGTRNQPEDARA